MAVASGLLVAATALAGAGGTAAQFEETPLLLLDTATFQKPLKQDGVTLTVKCEEAPCTANATGTVKFPKGKTYDLEPLGKQLAKDTKEKFKLGLSNQLRRAIRKYFKTGKVSRAAARARAAARLLPGAYDGINARGNLVQFEVSKAGKVRKFKIDYTFKCSSGDGRATTSFGPSAKIGPSGRFTLKTTGSIATGRVVNAKFAKGTFRRTFNDPAAGRCDSGTVNWSANREGSGEGGKGKPEKLPPIRELDARMTVKLTDASGKVVDQDSIETILEP